MQRARLLLLLSLSPAIGCDKTVPTPAGAAVLAWKSSGKLSVSDWTLGAPKGNAKIVVKTYRCEPGDLGKPMRFELAVESGPMELVDATPRPDKPESVLAPRTVKITIVDNPSWAATGECDDDLAVPLAVRPDGTSAYPTSVWARCALVLKRKNGDITVVLHFDLHGDGRIEPSLGANEKLVAE